jgi:hypothetical protein
LDGSRGISGHLRGIAGQLVDNGRLPHFVSLGLLSVHSGVILYGPPTGLLTTVTKALGEIDSRFVVFEWLKAGPGRIAGYRLVTLEELGEIDGAGQLVHLRCHDDALYGIDRPMLLQQMADGLVPVIQLEQADGIDALLATELPIRWRVVRLLCPQAASGRLGPTEVPSRAEVPASDRPQDDLPAIDPESFDLILNTVSLPARTVAALIARTVALEPVSHASTNGVSRRARQLFGRPRFIGYLQHCGGSEQAALELYRWNNAISAALWEVIGYLEIALRNALAAKMSDRHRRLRRRGSWLDDPLRELDPHSRDDILKARARVVRKSKPASDGQTIAELGFGFWRYLLVRRYSSNLWPDLAGAFPHAPDRARETVELPVVRLNDFRNRLAHHERVWTTPLRELHTEMILLLAYMDEDLSRWVADQSRVEELLSSCPQLLPNP